VAAFTFLCRGWRVTDCLKSLPKFVHFPQKKSEDKNRQQPVYVESEVVVTCWQRRNLTFNFIQFLKVFGDLSACNDCPSVFILLRLIVVEIEILANQFLIPKRVSPSVSWWLPVASCRVSCKIPPSINIYVNDNSNDTIGTMWNLQTSNEVWHEWLTLFGGCCQEFCTWSTVIVISNS